MRLPLISLLVIGLAFAKPGYAQDAPNANTVVATVNDAEITLGHMLIARQRLPQQFQELPAEVLFPGILDQLIQQTVLEQNFHGELSLRAQLQLENERRTLAANEFVDALLARAVTEDAVAQIYDSEYADAEPSDEYNASHILVETEEEAQVIVDQLGSGADFATLAKEKSTGPSGPGGGGLGWFGKGAMVPDFEAAVIALQAGEVSAPVQTQFGWHVIKLNDKRNKTIPTLDEVRLEIENRIRESVIELRLAELTKAAKIDRSGAEALDASLIGQFDLLQ